jgi:hypothetical protein
MSSAFRILRVSVSLSVVTALASTSGPVAHAEVPQASQHHGVCRNSFNGCDSDVAPCDDFLSCYGDELEGALIAVAIAMALILTWEIAVPAAVISALPEIAEAAAVTTDLAEATAVEATAAEATAAEATAAEVTAAEATAAEVTAAEATAAEATAAEATAAEATAAETTAAEATAADATVAEATAADATAAEATTEAVAEEAADDALVDVAEGEDVIPQEIYNDHPELADINPGEYRTNCPAVSQAARDILDGGPAVQVGDSGTATVSQVQQAAGSYFNPMSLQETEQQLLAAGDGANGTVGTIPPNGGVGHVFNAVNRGGQVVWLDAQNVTARTTAEVVARYAGYRTLFMP